MKWNIGSLGALALLVVGCSGAEVGAPQAEPRVTFLDVTWRMPVLEGIDAQLRERDFEALVEARAAFDTLEVQPALKQLKRAGRELSNIASANYEKDAPAGSIADDAADPQIEEFNRDATVGSHVLARTVSGVVTVAFWDYALYKKAITGGEHSAVMLRAYTSTKKDLFKAGSATTLRARELRA